MDVLAVLPVIVFGGAVPPAPSRPDGYGCRPKGAGCSRTAGHPVAHGRVFGRLGLGRRAKVSLMAPPQPLSLTVPRIYPHRRWIISSGGQCLQEGGERHSPPYGHGDRPGALQSERGAL